MSTKELSNALIRTDFFSFVQRVFYEVSGGQILVPNWHIRLLCDHLERARRGEIKRLIINVPPRSLKSIIVNVAFTVWLLAHNPREKVISASYSNDLADTFARDCKRVMSTSWFKELFPNCVIAPDQTSADDFKTTARGGRFSTSVESTFTGRGGNFIIIDDPIKASDAMSEPARNKVIEWYQHTLLSRLDSQENGVIILIMQRVHENDLTGYLLEHSNEWTHIKIPEIATADERWQVGTTTYIRRPGTVLHAQYMSPSRVQELQQTLGISVWSAQYQQDPTPDEGGIIKEKWLQYYDNASLGHQIKPKQVFISWDTANKTGENNAYSVGCVILLTMDYKFYLIDVVRGRWDTPELFNKILDEYNKYKYDQHAGNYVKILIEDKASGEFLAPMLYKAHDRAGNNIDVEAIKPNGDKISRAKAASVMIEKGNLLFPKSPEPWWPEFKKELLGFPGTKYKDQVDALSQCINYAMSQN